MSDYIPFEIQSKFIKRLPVKSLLRFRSVSKRWKSLIDSREFIRGYGFRQTQPRRLLVLYADPLRREETYISLVDDETFVKQEISPTVPVLAKLLRMSFMSRVVGSSHGLLCLYGNYSSYYTGCRSEGLMVVLWNPSIRKSVGILLPTDTLGGLGTVLGFGVCPTTSDPTMVKVSGGVVEVFTLSSGSWRILSGNLPNKSIRFTWSHVAIDRFIYWVAYDKMMKNLLVSFDMTTHEFRTVDMPDDLACRFSSPTLSIFKVSGALAVLKYDKMGTGAWHVWIMDHGVPNSCTKVVTVNNVPGERLRRVLGLTERCELIFERQDGRKGRKSSMFVYEPSSQYIHDIGIYGRQDSVFVDSYEETLLLLDQSDGSVYVENSVGPMDCRLWINSLPKEVRSAALPLTNRRFSMFSLIKKLRKIF